MAAIFGIKNCDTMKKAFSWLEANGIACDFHDYKKSGIDAATLARWEKVLGWETLLNRRGSTWRKLDGARQAGIDRATALRLMQEQPALIKRPVFEQGTTLLCGFDPENWRRALAG
ncbi:MAG: arsenate reductase [Pseudomonadota bacterium]